MKGQLIYDTSNLIFSNSEIIVVYIFYFADQDVLVQGSITGGPTPTVQDMENFKTTSDISTLYFKGARGSSVALVRGSFKYSKRTYTLVYIWALERSPRVTYRFKERIMSPPRISENIMLLAHCRSRKQHDLSPTFLNTCTWGKLHVVVCLPE